MPIGTRNNPELGASISEEVNAETSSEMQVNGIEGIESEGSWGMADVDPIWASLMRLPSFAKASL